MQDLSPHRWRTSAASINHFSDNNGSLVSGQGSDMAAVIRTKDSIVQQLHAQDDQEGRLYRGLARVVYMLYQVSQCPTFSAHRDTYLR